LHVGLIMALAYFLAFRPSTPSVATPDDPPILYRELQPPVVTPPTLQPPTIFKPMKTEVIEAIHTHVPPLIIPPVDNPPPAPPTIVTTTEPPPAQKVIVNPKPIFRGGLVYPDIAADRNISGYVDFAFIIEPDGSVGDPQVIAEVPDGYGFAAAAKKAFPKWRFEPELVDGRPVAAPATIRVVFKLQ
jgi:TonB family protein